MTGVSETPPGGSIATLTTYSYDALSRRTGLAYANTTSSTYAYDDFSGLTAITHNFAATSSAPVVTYSYTRDANERRQTDTVSITGLLQHPLTAGTTTYQANSLNQYATINGQTLTYGARGNLGTDPTAPLGSASYAFDNHSRLITATNSQHSASYTYDAFARRSQSTVDGSTKMFVNDGSRTIADYTSSGVEIQHFVYGADSTPILTEYFGGQPTPQQHWQHTDALGSTVYLTDNTGMTTASFHYSPWGEGSTTGQTPYLYAGMRIDPETLLYYDHARYYSPAQGRFISADPIGVKGGVDLYAYVGNDPLNATDPTGLIRPSFDQVCGGDGPSCAPPRTYFPGGSGGSTPQQGSDASGLGTDVTDFAGSFAQGLGGGDGTNASLYTITQGGNLLGQILVPDNNDGSTIVVQALGNQIVGTNSGMQTPDGTSVDNASGPANLSPYISPTTMQHILSTHGAFGNVDPLDGQFYPQFSTRTVIQELADIAYANATSFNVGSAVTPNTMNGAKYALTFAAVNIDPSTGQTIPNNIGTVTPGGPATNFLIMILNNNNKVSTMYPGLPIILFQGGPQR